MGAHYSVVTVRLDSKELFPLLIDNSTGIGVFEPTAYCLSKRSRGCQVNTLNQAMRAVEFLFEVLYEADIDLLDRAKSNELLTLGEIEALVERSKVAKSEISNATPTDMSSKVIALHAGLRKSDVTCNRISTVSAGTTATRLHYIGDYLKWFADYVYLLNLSSDRGEFSTVSRLVTDSIKHRSPRTSKSRRKQGLTKQQEKHLLDVVSPSSPLNPWATRFTRIRNFVIIRLLLALGIRKGELLGLKVEDINFRENTISIQRRPDDGDDQRLRQPQVKTASRILPIAPELAGVLKGYLLTRSELPIARTHPFVVVSESGDPMAINSIDYMFSVLRSSFQHPSTVSAHVLRHTWNDRFSELVEGKMSEAEERQLRNYLMGWSDQSRMAENYTARYVEKRAKIELLKLQDATFGKANGSAKTNSEVRSV